MFPSEVLEELISYEVASNREDLIAAFQLLYKSYLRAGLVVPCQAELRITPYHLQPSTKVVVTKCNGTVVSTISLIGDSELGLPMEAMYPDEIAELRARGLRLAEVGSLADRREDRNRFLSTFFDMTRVLAQAARHRGIDALVAAVHPRHSKFYTRLLGFTEFGNLTSCPYVQNRPAVALYLNFEESRKNQHYDRYFKKPISAERLTSYEMTASDRKYFSQLVDSTMLASSPQ